MAAVTVIKFTLLYFNYFQLVIKEKKLPSIMYVYVPMNMLKYCLDKTCNYQVCKMYIYILIISFLKTLWHTNDKTKKLRISK